MVHISKSNSKMGKTPSFSTAPIIGCSENACVCREKCYAVKSYRLYPSVKNAWNENLELTKTTEGRAQIEKDVTAFCRGKRKPVSCFRWFVSGDINSDALLLTMCRIAKACPDTAFLCFTKAYQTVNRFCAVNGKNTIPRNLVIVFSEWFPLPLDNPYRFPIAKFVPRGDDLPQLSLVCPNALNKSITCAKCCRCWCLSSGDIVAFPEH